MEAGRRGILQLSNTMPLGPAHRAWPWEEQTSWRPCPRRFVAASLQLPLTALGVDLLGGSRPLPTPLGRWKKDCSPALNLQGKTRPRVQHHQPSNVTLYSPPRAPVPTLPTDPGPQTQLPAQGFFPKSLCSRLGAPPPQPRPIDGRALHPTAQSEHL